MLALITNLMEVRNTASFWDLLRSDVNPTVCLTERIVSRRRGVARCGRVRLSGSLCADRSVLSSSSSRSSARGRKSSANIWGQFAAATGRVVSSVFCGDEFRCEIYVDDPLVAAGGSLEAISRNFTVALLAVAVLGFLLAWDKASLGGRVVWIGALLSVEDLGLSCHSKGQARCPAQTSRFLSATRPHLHKRRIFGHSAARFRSWRVWSQRFGPSRSFVDMVWAALASSSRLPLELVHRRRFWVALWWLQALFSEVPGPLVRVLPVTALWALEVNYIATDACHWGFAGVPF